MKKRFVFIFVLCFFPSLIQAGYFDEFSGGRAVSSAPGFDSFDRGNDFRLDKPTNRPKLGKGIFDEIFGLFNKQDSNAGQPVKFRPDWKHDTKLSKVFTLFRPQSENFTKYVDYAENYEPVCRGKSKITAAVLAIFLGGFGVHKYYLGETRMGVIYTCVSLISCFILYPLVHLVGIVEGILYLVTPDDQFHAKYCPQHRTLARW